MRTALIALLLNVATQAGLFNCMAGFVYILSNPLFTRIKIGKPTKDRLNELNSETDTPEKYKCEYNAFVGDKHGLE